MPGVPKQARRPFRADQLRSGDPYELSNGHAIYVAPAGGRHAASGMTVDQAAAALSLDVAFVSAAVRRADTRGSA
jgi:hypothetical protein